MVYSTISSFLTAERNPCACIFSCFPSWSSRLERPFSHFGQGLPPSYCWVTWGWLRRKILRTVTWKPEKWQRTISDLTDVAQILILLRVQTVDVRTGLFTVSLDITTGTRDFLLSCTFWNSYGEFYLSIQVSCLERAISGPMGTGKVRRRWLATPWRHHPAPLSAFPLTPVLAWTSLSFLFQNSAFSPASACPQQCLGLGLAGGQELRTPAFVQGSVTLASRTLLALPPVPCASLSQASCRQVVGYSDLSPFPGNLIRLY